MKFKIFDYSLDGKPAWKLVLHGAAIPAMIIAFCVMVAAIYSLFQGSEIRTTIEVGIIVGLFFSIWGGLENMVGLLLLTESRKNGFFLSLGYALSWTVSLIIIFK